MNFSQALQAVHQGEAITRAGWNGKDMCVILVKGSIDYRDMPEDPEALIKGIPAHLFEPADADTCMRLPTLAMKTADGGIVHGWLASQADMAAQDWAIVEHLTQKEDAAPELTRHQILQALRDDEVLMTMVAEHIGGHAIQLMKSNDPEDATVTWADVARKNLDALLSYPLDNVAPEEDEAEEPCACEECAEEDPIEKAWLEIHEQIQKALHQNEAQKRRGPVKVFAFSVSPDQARRMAMAERIRNGLRDLPL